MKFEEYLETLPIRESTLRKYQNLFKNIPEKVLNSIDEINRFLAERSRKFNDSRLYYAVIKHYLTYKEKYDLIRKMRYPKNQRQIRIPNYYDLGTIFRILDNMEKENYRVAGYVQFFGGMRASEVMRIKRKDVKLFKDYAIVIVRTAKREPYEVKIVGKGFEVLKSYLKKQNFNSEALIFCSETRSASEEHKISTNIRYYQKELKKAGYSLGYEITPHDLKRNLAKYLQEKGVSVEEIKEALHHKNIETTLIYIGKVSTKRVEKALKNTLSSV